MSDVCTKTSYLKLRKDNNHDKTTLISKKYFEFGTYILEEISIYIFDCAIKQGFFSQ